MQGTQRPAKKDQRKRILRCVRNALESLYYIASIIYLIATISVLLAGYG